MLDPRLLRSETAAVFEKLKRRGVGGMERYLGMEKQRKVLQLQVEALQEESNKSAKFVGHANVGGRASDVKKQLQESKKAFIQIQEKLDNFLLRIPNIPHPSVPQGESEKDNELIRSVGIPPEFSFYPLDHTDICKKEGWINMQEAVPIAGSRFVVLKGPVALLHRALIQFMLDHHTANNGYSEVNVPYMTLRAALLGTGQMPKFEEDLFRVDSFPHPLYLVPTAEVPVTNLVRDKILKEEEFPIKWVCHSPCFRSEAGSYGKDTKGMFRLHQFEKVELVQISHPERSWDILEQLTRDAETILQALKLPYQVVSLCTADLGFASAKTYDIEVWFPAQRCYREVSSCSNMTDFQARRIKARFRPQGQKKLQLVHTLNGSGLAIGRTMIAVMENYQIDRGEDVTIPQVLRKYFQNNPETLQDVSAAWKKRR